MWNLSKNTKEFVEPFFAAAREQAKQSTCERRKCGAVIVSKGVVIGEGFSSPAGNLESQRRCEVDKYSLEQKITDKTCCVHAEQRAIIDALKRGHNLKLSVMYFVSVGWEGNELDSGKPYCTLCSKLALDVGVARWILNHGENTIVYNSNEYNQLSLNYHR